MRNKVALLVLLLCSVIGLVIWSMMGAGGFRRMVTLTGVYSICRPDGYDAVCFVDADGREGGLFCMPLSAVGGACRK